MNIKLGLIVTNYNCVEFIDRFLDVWLSTVPNLKIVFLDGLFEGFDGETQNSNDGSLEKLENYYNCGLIDGLIKLDKPMKETEARNLALDYLKKEGVDLVWSTAPDELPKPDMISKVLEFIKQERFIAAWRLNFKNLTFTKDTYTDFSPFRIWRMKVSGYEIDSFYDDDGMLYKGTITRDFKKDKDFAHQLISKTMFHAEHETWLNNERSRKKVAYQERRWAPPNGFGCSFKWDNEKGLTWNENYFKLTGQQIPELQRD